MAGQKPTRAPFTEETISEIVGLYARGAGESISSIAKAYSTSPATIHHHLKKRGELAEQQRSETMGPDFGGAETVIDEMPQPGMDISAIMAMPELQQMIAQAVAERVAQIVTPQAGAPEAPTNTFEAFTETVKHLIQINAQQQPGYQKPLPADEIDRRLNGKIEMFALLEKFQDEGTPPLWIVGANSFFECTNAQEFAPGERIRTYLPPAEDFIPENDEAKLVHAAMKAWLGVPTPEIGEQLKQAQLNSKMPPLVSGSLQPERRAGLVETVGGPKVELSRKRSMGTVVPERRDMSMAERAANADASGPVFVAEAAAA